ncbi:MAG: phosphatase PAP2 family protein [Nocardioides sp.]
MQRQRLVPSDLRALSWTALGMIVATALIFGWKQLPIRDPDYALVGPGWLVIPMIVVVAVGVDVLGRVALAALRARLVSESDGPNFAARVREVWARRWPRDQRRFLVLGLLGWYLCYSAFRNLKHAVPFVTDRLWDTELTDFDQALFLGNTPWEVLHQVFGTGAAAYLFSTIYVVWIGFVPISIWWALVWTRARATAAWYVTALGFGWAFGALGYFAIPSLGPIYSDPTAFTDLPQTRSAWLAQQLADDRLAVVPPTGDPHSAHVLQTIAAWPSLHVGIMVIASLIVFSKTRRSWLRASIMGSLVLTMLATIYLGWHFTADVFGGIALGTAAVWLAGRATGNRMRWMPPVTADVTIVDRRTDAPAE